MLCQEPNKKLQNSELNVAILMSVQGTGGTHYSLYQAKISLCCQDAVTKNVTALKGELFACAKEHFELILF